MLETTLGRSRVSANWRITFRFDGTDVSDVDLVDYHSITTEEQRDNANEKPSPPRRIHPLRTVVPRTNGISAITDASERNLALVASISQTLVNCKTGISPEMAIRISRKSLRREPAGVVPVATGISTNLAQAIEVARTSIQLGKPLWPPKEARGESASSSLKTHKFDQHRAGAITLTC